MDGDPYFRKCKPVLFNLQAFLYRDLCHPDAQHLLAKHEFRELIRDWHYILLKEQGEVTAYSLIIDILYLLA